MTSIPHPISYADPHTHSHELGFLKKYIFSADHKIIGIQFLFLGLAFMVVGGLLAMLVRWQLAYPTPELQEKHPVPVLGRYLWPQFKADAPLGTIQSIDTATGTVVVGNAAVRDSTVGDTIKIVNDAGAAVTTAKVEQVNSDTVV